MESAERFEMSGLRMRFTFLIVILFLSSVTVFVLTSDTKEKKKEIDLTKLPLEIGQWKGKDLPVEQNIRDILETNMVMIREYFNKSGVGIVVAVVYYKDSRVALHLPESCLLGFGSVLTERSLLEINIPGEKNFFANRLQIENSLGKYSVLYFYQAKDFFTASYYKFRLRMLLHKIRGLDKSGALVRFTIFVGDSPFKTKEMLLQEFVGDFAPILPKYLY